MGGSAWDGLPDTVGAGDVITGHRLRAPRGTCSAAPVAVPAAGAAAMPSPAVLPVCAARAAIDHGMRAVTFFQCMATGCIQRRNRCHSGIPTGGG